MSSEQSLIDAASSLDEALSYLNEAHAEYAEFRARRYAIYERQICEILAEIKQDIEELSAPDSLPSRQENWAADSRF